MKTNWICSGKWLKLSEISESVFVNLLCLLVAVTLGLPLASSIRTWSPLNITICTASGYNKSGVSVSPLTRPADAECWAVIIGVSDYKYLGPAPFLPFPWESYDLRYADDDAKELYKVLSSAWGESHTRILVDADATKTAINKAIVEWLAPREDANDIVLIFFSGHGLANWLAPYDSLSTSYANDISYITLNSWLDSLDSTRIVIALNACGSGAYGSHLSDTGRVVLTSCTSAKSSWESSVLKHGVFSKYLLECFTEKTSDEAHYIADANRDHIISAEEIFYYLKPKVIDWANQNSEDQHPQLFDNCAGQVGLVSYKTRYYLTVASEYGVTKGSGWYDEGTTATFSVSGGTTWYRSFGGWSGDATGNDRTSTVIMNGPMTIKAIWKIWWVVWMLAICGGIGVVLLLLLIVRRRPPLLVKALRYFGERIG